MPKATESLINYLYAVAGTWRDDSRDDAELLARYAENGDEAAFKSIVWRHGPMVWQTCKRVLGNGPDAEDAFQITFLTLTRKAGRLRRQPLAGWLHRVARQTALNSNIALQRRRKLEHQPHLPMQTDEKDAGRSDLCEAIDEELNGLPEKLRVPLVLHYLEEKTQEEVAHILGCSRNTAQKRLAKGEIVLRKRLEQRGLALGVGSLAALLRDKAGASSMPAGLMASTARAAVAFRAGTFTGVTADAAQKMLRSLAVQGTVRTSWWLMLACVGLLGVGGAGLVVWKMCVGVSDTARPEASGLSTAPKPAAPKVVAKPLNKHVDRYGDPLPEGALARIGTVRFRVSKNERPVYVESGIAFLPDGKTLISLQGDFLCFWDIFTGKKLRQTKGIPPNSRDIAVSPDGKVLATSGEYWDLTTNPPQKLQRALLPASWIKERPIASLGGGVAFSPDGRTVAWANDDLVDLKDEGGPESYDIYLVDAATGKVKKKLKDEKHPQDQDNGFGRWHLAFSSDSETLAAGGWTGRTTLWDVATGAKKLQIPGDGSPVTYLAFLPDGQTLLENRMILNKSKLMVENRMRFLNVATGAERRSPAAVPGPNSFWIKNWAGKLCLSPDGKLLALMRNCVISIWNMATDREIGPTEGFHNPVANLIFSADNKKLATLADTVQLWETGDGRLDRTLDLRPLVSAWPLHQNYLWINSFCYPDTRHLELIHLPALPDEKSSEQSFSEKMPDLLCWDIETGKIKQRKERLSDTLSPLFARLSAPSYSGGIVSSDGRWLALTLTDGLALIDRVTGKEVHRFQEPQELDSAAFSLDGQSVLTVSSRGRQLNVWSTETGKRRMSLNRPMLKIVGNSKETYALSSHGSWLAIGSNEGDSLGEKVSIQLLNVAPGIEKENKFSAPKSKLASLVWSPDDRLLAGGDLEGTIWLWDVATGQEIRRFTGHRGGVSTLAFSPDGLQLASGSEDTTALIWDTTALTWDLPGQSLEQDQRKDRPSLETLWGSLHGKDAAAARRSINLLAQDPDVAVPLLRERLRPASIPSNTKVTSLLPKMDDDEFQVRNQAEKQLEKILNEDASGLAYQAIYEALAKKPSPEASQHIQRVLYKVLGSCTGPYNWNWLQVQAYRGTEVLERIGTPAAREVLEELARLPEVYVQAGEARAALRRLSKQAPASTP